MKAIGQWSLCLILSLILSFLILFSYPILLNEAEWESSWVSVWPMANSPHFICQGQTGTKNSWGFLCIFRREIFGDFKLCASACTHRQIHIYYMPSIRWSKTHLFRKKGVKKPQFTLRISINKAWFLLTVSLLCENSDIDISFFEILDFFLWKENIYSDGSDNAINMVPKYNTGCHCG